MVRRYIQGIHQGGIGVLRTQHVTGHETKVQLRQHRGKRIHRYSTHGTPRNQTGRVNAQEGQHSEHHLTDGDNREE